MNVITLLEKARARIEKGWCRHQLQDLDGNVCALGALQAACGFSTPLSIAFGKHVDELVKDGAFDDVRRSAYLQPASALAWYNNSHTKKDVLALFDRTIARLKAERGVEKLKELTVIPVVVPVKETA